MTEPVFAPPPDLTRPMIERLQWRTDVQIGTDGSEQRTQLRAWPWLEYAWQAVILPEMLEAEPGSPQAAYEALLRSGGAEHAVVRVPLFPHAVLPSETLTRGLTSSPEVLYLSASGEQVDQNSPEAVFKAPSALAHLSVRRTAEWTTDQFATCWVEARVINHFELVANPSPVDSLTLMQIGAAVLRHDWTTPVREAATIDVLRRETYHAFTEKGRYEKRSLTLDVVAPDDASIVLLRRFLFHLRGRLNAFPWAPQPQGLAGNWRLDQDVVEIAYITRNFAQTRLTFVQV